MANTSIKERNYNLDILRIVAALMVLMVHIGYQFPWISDYTWYGFYGTSLFFALSGYLTFSSIAHCNSALDFYKKRVIRIIPLYWVVLIITAMLNHQLLSVKFLRYFLFLHMFVPSDDFVKWNNINGLWTMSAFMFFYLIAPVLYKIIRKYYVGLAVFTVMLFKHDAFVEVFEKLLLKRFPYISDSYTFASWHPFSVLYVFVGGAVAYLAVKERRQISLAVLCMLSMVYNDYRWHAWDIIMVLVVLCAASFPNMPLVGGKVKIAGFVKLCADCSFPLYLTHTLVLSYIMILQYPLVPVIRNKGFLAFVILACLLVGFLSYKFIDAPLNRLIGSKVQNIDNKLFF